VNEIFFWLLLQYSGWHLVYQNVFDVVVIMCMRATSKSVLMTVSMVYVTVT